MIYRRNLIGIINSFFISLIFFSVFIFCTPKQNQKPEVIGNDIIKNNINILLDSLSIFGDSTIGVELERKIEKGDIPNNKDIFGITNRIQLRIQHLNPKNFYAINITKNQFILNTNRKIFVREVDRNELHPSIIAIQMSNFYLNTDKNEAFIIVNKGIKGSAGQKMDIYYFKKIKNKWKYEGKDILLQG